MLLDVKESYKDWLIYRVCSDRYLKNARLYSKLLSFLLTREFYWSNPMDSNRETDGLNLRDLFLYEHPEFLDDAIYFETMGACTVLEMMVALAVRVEETIMSDDIRGDRTGKWFWSMIESMQLDQMTDYNFDKEYIKAVLYRCLDRTYDYDGSGGFFTIPDSYQDMRDVEIWYQMLWYLDYIIENEGE